MSQALTDPGMVPGKSPGSHYWDSRFQRNAVKLLPGEYCVGHDEEMIVTVLGSCITACIYESVLGVGGMNHFMLPCEKPGVQKPGGRVTDYDSRAARYGNVAMERLINEIIKLGGMRENLQAKIFGGARITNASMDIGAGNISFVREYLELEGIVILSEDIGGRLPRKVYYLASSNEVFIKKVERSDSKTLIVRESKYHSVLKQSEMEGEVFFLDP